MKTKVWSLLAASCLLALVAWFVHERNPARSLVEDAPDPGPADAVPEKYRETVHKGLEYLVKNQFEDGHWEGDGGQHPVAMTGLAGVAFLMNTDHSNYFSGLNPIDEPDEPCDFDVLLAPEEPVRAAKYAAQVRKAVDWLIEKSQPGRDGLIFSGHPSESNRYMQGHGLATLFLAGACKDEDDRTRQQKITDVLNGAVKYIVKSQSSQGGWHHTSKLEGHDFDDFSATVIQIQALQAAEIAGVPVPPEVMNDAHEYLKTSLGKNDDGVLPGPSRDRPAETAAAFACRFNSGNVWDDASRMNWLKDYQSAIPKGRDMKLGRDEPTHFYYAQAEFLGRATWNNYRTATFDRLQTGQSKDGSWPSSDGVCVGRVYATAVWCIVLQLESRRYPSQRIEMNIL